MTDRQTDICDSRVAFVTEFFFAGGKKVWENPHFLFHFLRLPLCHYFSLPSSVVLLDLHDL